MEKAFQMGKTSATGSFQLFIGVAVSTVIMFVGTLILGILLGRDGYGLYIITLTPASLIGLFRDWGVNSAMTKYIAGLRMENKDSEIRDIIVTGLTFEIILGLVLTLVSLLSANFIGTLIYHRSNSVSLISVISFSIFGNALLAAAQSSFIGYERMGLNSFTLICQAIVKTAIGPTLVILGYGVMGASIGYAVASLVAGAIGIVILYFSLFRKLPKTENKRFGPRERLRGLRATLNRTLKIMLQYGVPLSVSTVLSGILTSTYGLALASFVSNNGILGDYGMATNFTVLLTFLSTPISTVLFPAFAKLDPKKEHGLVGSIFASSVKYACVVLVPATLGMMVLSKPLISTLFLNGYPNASLFLTLLVIVNLLAIFGNLSLGSFLQGLGETKMAMKLGIVTTAVGLPLGFILIPPYGVLGVIIGSSVYGIPSMVWGLYWIWKRYEAKAELHLSARIFAASVLAAIPALLIVSFLHTTALSPRALALTQLVTGLVVFLLIYILGAPLIGAVSQSDISTIRDAFSGLGIVSKIINIPLHMAEKAAQKRTTKNRQR